MVGWVAGLACWWRSTPANGIWKWTPPLVKWREICFLCQSNTGCNIHRFICSVFFVTVSLNHLQGPVAITSVNFSFLPSLFLPPFFLSFSSRFSLFSMFLLKPQETVLLCSAALGTHLASKLQGCRCSAFTIPCRIGPGCTAWEWG